MAWFQEVRNSKPLFLTIYLTLMIGILFSSFFLFSAIYNTSSWQFSASDFPPLNHTLNTSYLITVGDILAPDPQPLENMSRPLRDVPPSGSKMPPLKDFQLTKELVQKRVKDNVIIVTFGNYAFIHFILNWVKHLTDLQVDNLLVGAMDTQLLQALYWKGVPVFDMGSHMSTVDVGWGSEAFHKMGREKVILIDAMLQYGYELLMCDTDMVWLKNPLPYFARYPEADILTSSDQVVPTIVDDRLDKWQQVGAAYNIGIFHWRPTDSSKKLAKEWKEMLLADEKIWDQNGFNDIVRRQLGPSVDEESGLAYAYDGKLKLGILPASIFCSGHTYFVQAMYQQLRLEPYAIHTTFQYSGTEGKRHRLREAMAFYDPPEYYDPPESYNALGRINDTAPVLLNQSYAEGFLTFKPSIPKSLLLDGEHNIESHFSLVNYQMKQIRTALAVALLLNRTLVLPPMWCRLDRLWYPHPGVLKGSMTRQPFICPLDHVLMVKSMARDLPEEFFGPQIRIREYSLFENPSTPVQVKESWLDVQLCQHGSNGCGVKNSTGPLGVLRFPTSSSEEKFKAVFSSYKNIKVIRFSSMQDAFTGFSDKTREKLFRARMTRYASVWCCLNMNHTLSHIYYDMYWDEKPGWKPVPPRTPEDDNPPWQD